MSRFLIVRMLDLHNNAPEYDFKITRNKDFFDSDGKWEKKEVEVDITSKTKLLYAQVIFDPAQQLSFIVDQEYGRCAAGKGIELNRQTMLKEDGYGCTAFLSARVVDIVKTPEDRHVSYMQIFDYG